MPTDPSYTPAADIARDREHLISRFIATTQPERTNRRTPIRRGPAGSVDAVCQPDKMAPRPCRPGGTGVYADL